jgi:formamidopyrimidine-DNA glycosylase
MPELPEVETIRRDLSASILGKSFVGVTLNWPRMVQIPSPQAFEQRLKGKTIAGLDRRGKYLIFRLSSGESLILHFGMSGSLLLDPQNQTDRHIRAIFLLDDGSRLYLRDPRKLGGIWLVEDENRLDRISRLGPEALDPHLTAEAFVAGAKGHSAPIKAVLLDQSFIAGVGNMYADEALFAARIHPTRRANSLSHEELTRLFHQIRRILEEAIGCCGASISDYRRPDGQPGTAQFVFKVAHRLGEPCPVCATPIERIPIRQRGSYFCPNCQHKSR